MTLIKTAADIHIKKMFDFDFSYKNPHSLTTHPYQMHSPDLQLSLV